MLEVLKGKEWKKYHEAESIILDELIKIDEETDLLARIKDVMDELNMLLTLSKEQRSVFNNPHMPPMEHYRAKIHRIMTAKEEEIDKLTKHADRVYKAVSTVCTNSENHVADTMFLLVERTSGSSTKTDPRFRGQVCAKASRIVRETTRCKVAESSN
jgi:hypothetical protein